VKGRLRRTLARLRRYPHVVGGDDEELREDEDEEDGAGRRREEGGHRPVTEEARRTAAAAPPAPVRLGEGPGDESAPTCMDDRRITLIPLCFT